MLPEEVAQIEHDLATAENARALGNEGRARVCARRAAGIAIQVYYRSRGEQLNKNNVIDGLLKIKNDPLVDPNWKDFADLLLMRVTKNHSLPVQKDLIEETRRFFAEIVETLRRKSIER